MRIRILGQYWNFGFAPNMGQNYGFCDYDHRKIRVQSSLRGEKLIEIVLHELLHAAEPHLTEEFVTAYAREAAKTLCHKTIQARLTDGKG